MKPRSLFLAAGLGLLLPALPAHALISFGPPGALNSTAATDADADAADDVDVDPTIANDGASTWVTIWSSDNPLGGTIGSDFDLLFTRSTNDGVSWSAAAPLYAGAATDGTISDTQVQVAAGSAGRWVAVYSSRGASGVDTDIYYSLSIDSGSSWTNPIVLNSDAAIDGDFSEDLQPAVASNGAGKWVAVWKQSNLASDQVYFSYSNDNGSTWAARQALGGPFTTGLGQGTSVVFDGPDFVAAWGSTENLGGAGTDGDIQFSLIDTTAYTPTSAALLNSLATSDTGTDAFPSLASGPASTVAVWRSNDPAGGSGIDRDILFARSTTGGASWGSSALLASNGASDIGDDEAPRVAADGATFVAAWDTNDSLDKLTKTDGDVLTVRSFDDGATWTPVAPLSSTAAKDKGLDQSAALAANATTGTWAIVWDSTDTLFNTLGADEDILIAYSKQDCPSTPVVAATCFQPTQAGASSLTIKEGGAKDSLTWKWNKGADVDKALDIGNPTTTADYVFCLYDETGETPELITELDVPAGGNCFSKPCWKETTIGYSYKHKYGSASGMSVSGGTGGKAKAGVKAKTGFAAPTLPFDQDSQVSARLHNLNNGKCFAAEYSSSSANSASIFKGKSD